MTTPTFLPGQNPSVGSGASYKPRVISNQFGDGYRQTAPDGLNTAPRTLSLSWEMVDATPSGRADAIEAFFVVNAAKPFWWTPPRYVNPAKWECTEWSRTPVNGNADKITATFMERFDQGA